MVKGRFDQRPYAIEQIVLDAQTKHLIRGDEVGEAVRAAGLPLLARESVELALVPPAHPVLVDDLEPLVDKGQRRRAKEHVADVEGRVDAAVVLEPFVGRRVAEVVGRREEAGVGPALTKQISKPFASVLWSE